MSKKDTNDKQSLKSQRVKSYFIQAAKEIILSEGVENVSVRKVAERAGYTFTTIYNYFKDLNELLQETKNVMIWDVMSHMQSKMQDKIYDLEDIKKINRLYIGYYIERPHIFRFFYSYRLQTVKEVLPKIHTEIKSEVPDYDKLHLDTYRGFADRGIIDEIDIPVIAKTIIYSIQGLLALYFSDNGMTIDMLYEDLDKILDHLLKGRKEK